MCAAEAAIGMDDWLELRLSGAIALLEAVKAKIQRQDAMHANIARMIYLCSPGRKRSLKLSHFCLFGEE